MSQVANPIINAMAEQAMATDWPISGVTIASPQVTASPILAINWAMMLPDDAPETPTGVSASVLSRVPPSVVALPAMVQMEPLIIEAAWAYGAWDIRRTSIPASFSGAIPPYLDTLPEIIRREGYVSWYFRPMLRGPESRAKANAALDVTLNRWTLGRDTAPPDMRFSRIREGQETIIKLGKGEKTERPVRRPTPRNLATILQRGYLGRLLRAAGLDDTLPADLTKDQASAWIDRLKGKS
jgi:hypothetical protein